MIALSKIIQHGAHHGIQKRIPVQKFFICFEVWSAEFDLHDGEEFVSAYYIFLSTVKLLLLQFDGSVILR